MTGKAWTLRAPRSPVAISVALGAFLMSGGWLLMASRGLAQDAEQTETTTPAPIAPKPKPRHVVRKTISESGAEKVAKQSNSVAPPLVATVQNAAPDFAMQLKKAGAGACGNQINSLAGTTMGSVVSFNTLSNWSKGAGDSRVVSLEIGQKYAEGSAVPYGVSTVMAAPNRRGTCDGYAVQILPSPASCSKLRESLGGAGRQISDLVGIPIMQTESVRTMLIPTAANTCVLVATKSLYVP